ncbi:hypothetical protein GE061_003011 [Apolygus lucorum]|uniref:Uncharacterized protein n=1 Tax=Apolygus lucorum TaxID=248454 RepID=A0A6A4JRW9_APOLU|nr:hypothetical protein GE061_003011 [Apolygus lucorum]
MAPPPASTSGTLIRRAKFIKNASGPLQTGRSSRERRFHRIEQVLFPKTGTTSISTGTLRYRCPQCRCPGPARSCLRSRWSPA